VITEKVSPRYGKIVDFLNDKGGEITVGLHGNEGSSPHEGGLSTAEIGERHEFGLGVPERSFIRAWFDENKPEIERVLSSQLELSLKEGKSLDWALERVALWSQADIQRRIVAGIAPDNHPMTIARKGSSTPLIDTGVLKASLLAYVNGSRLAA
jgi:hypothetical protein